MIVVVDESVGFVLSVLNEFEFDDEMVVFFFFDNGGFSMFCCIGFMLNGFLCVGKGWLYEGGV